MINLQAIGFLLDYCNRHADEPGMNELFQKGLQEIYVSPEGRFEDCYDAEDVLDELGW